MGGEISEPSLIPSGNPKSAVKSDWMPFREVLARDSVRIPGGHQKFQSTVELPETRVPTGSDQIAYL